MSCIQMSRVVLRSMVLGGVVLCAGAATTCWAQAPEQTSTAQFPLHGRHPISLHGGLLSRGDTRADAAIGNVTANTSTTGFFGALSWTYGVGPEWAVSVTMGVVAAVAVADATIGGVDARAASVSALLVGAAWYPAALAIGPRIPPYASLAAGPYHRSAGGATVVIGGVVTEHTSATAAGARAMAGVDWFVGHRLRAGVAAGYHLVDNFDRPAAGIRSVSGPELSVGFGLLLGAGRR